MIQWLHANTLEIWVVWEQIEPAEGKFDFAIVDALGEQARARKIRLALLGFAHMEDRLWLQFPAEPVLLKVRIGKYR